MCHLYLFIYFWVTVLSCSPHSEISLVQNPSNKHICWLTIIFVASHILLSERTYKCLSHRVCVGHLNNPWVRNEYVLFRTRRYLLCQCAPAKIPIALEPLIFILICAQMSVTSHYLFDMIRLCFPRGWLELSSSMQPSLLLGSRR